MPFNGSGVFNRIMNWVNDAANSIPITASRTDTDSNDIAQGLTNCVTRDGQSPATANLPMGGFKHTNCLDASALNEYATLGQNNLKYADPTQTTNFTSKLNVLASDFTIAASPNNPPKALIVSSEVQSASAKAAYINFSRQTVFGGNFGIDTDNQWKVGGGSFGAVAYRVVTEQLTNVAMPGSINSVGRMTGGGMTSTNSLIVNSSGVLPNVDISDSTNGGNLRIHAQNTGHFTFRVSNSTVLEIVNNGYAAVVSTLDNSGNWTATNFSGTSDERLKKNIAPAVVNDRLADLIEICTYLWSSDDMPGRGPIAQRVREIAPEYVHEGTDEQKTLAIDKASLAIECVVGLASRLRKLEERS